MRRFKIKKYSKYFFGRFLAGLAFCFLSLNVLQAAEYQKFQADLSFYPQFGGSFRSGPVLHYYAFGSRNFAALNQAFQPIQFFTFSSDTGSVDLGDINGDGYDDLIEVSRTDISVRYQSEKGIFSNPVKILGGYFTSPPGVQYIEQINIAQDVNGDGFADLVVSSDYNYSYYSNHHGVLKKGKNLDCPYESTFSNRYWRNSDLRGNRAAIKTYIPSIYFQDLNRDGVQDLYCRYRNLVYYYVSGTNDSGQLTAFANRIIRSYPLNLQSEYASDFFLEDMDLDGKIDLVFAIVSGLGIKIKTDIQIFWGKGEIPDATLSERWTESGGFFTPLLLNNNREKQLLIPTMNLGVSFFVSYILEKKMLVKGKIYSLKDRKFTLVGDHGLSFIAADNLFPGFSVGDFNNDGYSDMALADDYGEIILHYGDTSMSGKKTLSLPMPGYGIIYTIVPNSGRNELLIYLPQKIPGYNSLRIYLVRFNG